MIVNDTGKARRVSIVLAVVLGILQLSIVPNVAILGGSREPRARLRCRRVPGRGDVQGALCGLFRRSVL